MAKNTSENKNKCKKYTNGDIVLSASTVKNAIIEQDDVVQSSFGGLAFIIGILDSLTCLAKLDSLLPPPNGHAWNWIRYSDVARLMIAMLCLRHTHFEDAREFERDTLVRAIAGTPISPESLRQKLDILAACPEAERIVCEAALQAASQAAMQDAACGDRRLIPLDIDPTPLDNRGSKKEKTGRTYDSGWGYCPMTSFVGTVPLFPELRPGPQHSIKGTPDFMKRCLAGTDSLCIPREMLLFRADCGLDGIGLVEFLLDAGVPFIIKRNARGAGRLSGAALLAKAKAAGAAPEEDGKIRGRRYYRLEIDDCPPALKGRNLRCIAEVRTSEFMPDGTRYISEELGAEAATWWTSLPDADPRTVVMLYHDHATMEQHHGELKTDMGIERLPSGKFETNRLYLQLAYVAMTVNRLIGDRAAACDPSLSPRPSRPAPKRLRMRTILKRYVFVPCRLVWTGRRFKIVLTSGYAHYDVFREIHAQC